MLHRPKKTEGWQSWRSGDELLTNSSQILQMLTQTEIAASVHLSYYFVSETVEKAGLPRAGSGSGEKKFSSPHPPTPNPPQGRTD